LISNLYLSSYVLTFDFNKVVAEEEEEEEVGVGVGVDFFLLSGNNEFFELGELLTGDRGFLDVFTCASTAATIKSFNSYTCMSVCVCFKCVLMCGRERDVEGINTYHQIKTNNMYMYIALAIDNMCNSRKMFL
jgi:hypothetical protein